MSDRYSDGFLKSLEEWTTYVFRWLQLRDWDMVLSDEVPEDIEAAASIHCVYGKRRATLRLAFDFVVESEKNMMEYLIHEMCHIVGDPQIKCIDHSNLALILGMPAWSVFQERHREAMEVVNDHWTNVLISLFKEDREYMALWDKFVAAARGELPETPPES